MIKSFIVAFSTYSKLPMPQFEWQEENMRYSMCFFPLIGAVIGLVLLGCDRLCALLGMNGTFEAMLLTVLPLLLTGGIHLDGFLDTVDARRSYQGREARLAILKDPHVGAFAVIYGILLILVQFGCFSQVGRDSLICMSAGYVLSRCLSGLSVVSFPKAKRDGMLRQVSDAAERAKHRVRICLIAEGLLTASVLLYLERWLGGAVLLAALMVFWYYRSMSEREFGGTTGDLAGWFLSVCETVMLLTAVTGGCIG